MTNEFFRLHTLPFTREVRIDQRIKIAFIEKEISRLHDVVEQRMSGVIIAPAGCGKTVLLRALQSALPEARYRVSYVKATDFAAKDMYREICTAIGAERVWLLPHLIRSIQEKMRHSYESDGLRPVLMIDDAHDIRPSVLSLLRVLTNFEMDSRLVVSIILSGQPALKSTLLLPALQDVRQRLSHYGELRPLSCDETKAYMTHRLVMSGCVTSPFDNAACEAIFEIARGNMRAIDSLSLKALKIAASEKSAAISTQHVILAKSEVLL